MRTHNNFMSASAMKTSFFGTPFFKVSLFKSDAAYR